MAHKIPYIKYLSALLLSGLNGAVHGAPCFSPCCCWAKR